MNPPEREATSGADRPDRILTVCLGNICRSPTAEAALLEAAQQAGIDIEVASAGTGDWHVGHAPHAPMRAAALDAGLELRGTAQQVDPGLLSWADLVVVMDRQNLADVRRMAEAAEVATPITLFREFDPELRRAPGGAREEASPAGSGGASRYAPDEVPDPYGGGAAGFSEVVEICRRTARSLIATRAQRPAASEAAAP